MTITETLTAILAAAFEKVGLNRKYGEVMVSQRVEFGQFQCNGAMAAAGEAKKSPHQVAQMVVAAAERGDIIKELSIAGPGFININLTDEWLASYLRAVQEEERFGYEGNGGGKRVVIDFGGPNVAKPMHVGHLRSSIIGDSLQRLFRFAGYDVLGDIHLGDWGTQMGQLIEEVRRRMPTLPYFDEHFEGPYPQESPVTIEDLSEWYPIASARCKEDATEAEKARQATVELQQGRPGYRALWQHFVAVSVEELKQDFEALGVHFDLWYGESSVHDRIMPMVKRLQEGGYTELSEGATIISVSQPSDESEVPPLILLKSDGGVLYGTTDLATIEERVEDLKADLILYVVDARQSLHFEQVFRAARKTGIARDAQLEHLGFGTVNGQDGKPFKTRAGGVMRLKDLIEMVTTAAHKQMAEIEISAGLSAEERDDIARKVGLAALKYADLSNHRMSDYIFDLERFTSFRGRTGPYILYSAVRIKSILRKAAARQLQPGALLPASHADERALMLMLSELPLAIQRTLDTRAPNHLCDFAYNLAFALNRFYNVCHILNEEDSAQQASWLTLSQLCLSQLEEVAHLLGLEIPEQM